jgi:arylsulfate sulfotransferase
LRISLYYLFLSVSFLTGACNPDQIDKIHGHFHPQNRLIYLIDFTLKTPGEAFIEYWIREDSMKRYTELSPVSMNHRISVYNLLPDTRYDYQIRIKQMDQIWESEAFTFKTDSLPSALPVFDLLKDHSEFDDYILLKAYVDPGALVILNRDARIVWYHLYDSSVVRPFQFTFDRHILSLVDSSIIEEITLEDNLIRRIDTRKHGIDRLHHELFKNHYGQYVGLTYTKKVMDLPHSGGAVQDTIQGDGMTVLDSLGNKIWEWNIFDHADPLADDSIFRHRQDWCHANSIAYDPDGNYLLSFRNFSQIWKIDAENGSVIWKIGKNGDFVLKGTEWFIRQHDAHIGPGGHLIMFDNGNYRRGYSRVLSLDLDERNLTCSSVLDLKLDSSHTAFRMGSVHMADGRHSLVCSPKKFLALFIIDDGGAIVWNARGSRDSYKAYIIPKEKIENTRWF